MVKAVAVLGNSNGVTGTINFNQEGNGKFQQRLISVTIMFFVYLHCAKLNQLNCIVNYAGTTTVTGNLAGLKPGLHGFHVHALGDTTNGFVLLVICFSRLLVFFFW